MLIAHQLACHRGLKLLVEHFSLRLTAGTGVWLTGPNGTGKSTLLRVLAGLQPPLRGSVERRARFIYQPPELGFDAELSLLDNLAWWATAYGASAQRIRLSLTRLEIATCANLKFSSLSKGQQQRAALARLVLADDAMLWLLDEPLSHLDEGGRRIFYTLLQAHLKRGGAMIAATHDVPPMQNMSIIELQAAEKPVEGGAA